MLFAANKNKKQCCCCKFCNSSQVKRWNICVETICHKTCEENEDIVKTFPTGNLFGVKSDKGTDHYSFRRNDKLTLKMRYARTNALKYTLFIELWERRTPFPFREATSVNSFKALVKVFLH